MPDRSKNRRARKLRKPQQLDGTCKQAMGHDRGRILKLILQDSGAFRELDLPDAVPTLLAQLPTEFERGDLDSDDLLKVAMGPVQFLLNTEYQSRPDPQIGIRVAEYQLASFKEHRLPVYSVVFNVSSPVRKPVTVESLQMGGLHCRWISVCVPEAVRQWPEHLDSPLAVVMRTLMGDLSEENLRHCLAELEALGIDQRACRDMVEALSLLIDRRQGGDGSRFKAIRNRLFTMLKLEESWIYEMGYDHGRDKERQAVVQQLQDKAIALSRGRFGEDELGWERVRRIEDPDQLLELVAHLGTSRSLSEALAAVTDKT